LGDQPHLLPATLRALLDFARRKPENICQPGRAGRARHPVFLPKTAFQKLGGSKDATLKEFLDQMRAKVRLIELDDPGLDLDLDCPADYEKALRLSPGE
jgi:CTP:molybdopterin cytidylyltransferase MocA